MSACSTFTEHVWKPGECKNCFKPKSLHCLSQRSGGKPPEQRPPAIQQQIRPPTGARANTNLTINSQRSGSGSAHSGHFRPPVAKKPTIAVKPTMMLPCSSAELDCDGNLQQTINMNKEQGKTSDFTIWNRNGLNHKRPGGPSNNNNNEGEDGNDETESYAQLSPRTPGGNNSNSGLTDVLKEIAGLGPGPSITPLSGSKDLFWGRISSSYKRSLERGCPASSCLAMGSSNGGGTGQKRVSLSDSSEIISAEGGRFCYPEFSSEDEEYEDEDEETERDDNEHESWDESDEELLAMEIRMRGQPRFSNFRAATLSPVPFAAGKKWNTVPLRNRSLQRICAVDYDDSYDEILNGYPSMDSNGALVPYGHHDIQGSVFLSNSESTTSPESSSSLPEDSRTTSSSGNSATCALRNSLHSPTSPKAPLPCTSPHKKEPVHKALSPLKVTETHKAVLAIRLEDQDGRDGASMPQAIPGQPVTISFSPTEEQAKPYRIVNLEKSLVCKPYTVVDVSASMANKHEQTQESNPKPQNLSSMPSSPTSFCHMPLGKPLSPTSPPSPSSLVTPISPTSVALSVSPRKKSGNTRYQEVWTSNTSPRQKIAKVDLGVGTNPCPSIPTQHYSHKSAPTSPIAGLSSSRTVPVKSSNLSEIKFNSFNNAGMPPFPIIIRDEPAYARSSKNAVKVPIVINPSAYDNLAIYKSFLGLSGELPQPKGVGSRIASHTYEEIGSSESVQTSTTISGRGTSERASFEETKAPSEALSKIQNVQPRTTTDSCTAISTVMSSTVGALPTITSASSPAILVIAANQHKTSPIANDVTPTCKTNGDGTSSKDDNTDLPVSSEVAVSHKEEASAVLLEIVAAIQPPRCPPESPSAQANSEELYALPPDAMKDTLTRHKTLFSATDGCLSKPKKDTLSKVLSKSQSASAAVPLSSPRSEPNAPFPPPRSTSSPYHASNILQRHFGNWTKSSASNSPIRPSESETSQSGEVRRNSTESSKPKRWISFKSFFRRRKDEDEQKERVEREKDKAKLVGLDGTVIHMLPPPPVQQHHYFTEAKPEDPTQKPTIIFTYKPESTSCDGEGELQVEECRESEQHTLDEGMKSSFPERTPTSDTTGSDLITKDFSQAPVIGRDGGDRGLPTNASLPLKVNLGHTLGEGEEGHANQVATQASASESSASLGEPEDDGSHYHHSHSPVSGQGSATYTNLGQSRANMIPLKQPRNIKASSDTLASTDLDVLADQPAPKATPPPPLPKKAVPRSSNEPSLGGKESVQGGLRPRAEARPGGTNLSVANPIYDLDSTWETASQSSSLSSEPHRVHDHESGDSLERQTTAVMATNKSRLTNSVSSLVPQPAPAAPSATTSRERRAYPSAESLAGRGRTSGRGFTAGGSKVQRPALYRGLDSWDEVVGRIRGLHTDTLRKLATKCEDRFMAGQKDHLRFGTDSWSHFRLTTGKPCCEAGDAVYYTASYAKDPLVNYAIKICRSKVKETQQQFFHSLAVRQSMSVHFNIQQDYGHFLADVPARLLPWEEENNEKEQEEDEEEVDGLNEKDIKTKTDSKAPNGKLDESQTAGHMNTSGHLTSRVVVITHEVPFQTVADFVREGVSRHTHNPELYERQVCLLLLQLCSGLEHMKPYHVTHCDLRLENLLLVHCQQDSPCNLDILEPNNNSNSGSPGATSAGTAATNATCPARLIISNFSQAKQKRTLMAADHGTLRDQSRLAPEIVTATQYRKCDEFQTGILIYEMLHRPNPFEETPELKEREYTWADLPPLPVRSLYSQGLQQLARLLLTVNPSERIRMSEARACLQCLLWGPREDLFQALGCSNTGPISGATSNQREVTLQNWLDLKRTLMMIKFAERSLDAACGVSLEDWLCCQYLAFATTDTLSRVVHILWQAYPQSQNQSQAVHAATSQTPAHQTHSHHLTQSQPL